MSGDPSGGIVYDLDALNTMLPRLAEVCDRLGDVADRLRATPELCGKPRWGDSLVPEFLKTWTPQQTMIQASAGGCADLGDERGIDTKQMGDILGSGEEGSADLAGSWGPSGPKA